MSRAVPDCNVIKVMHNEREVMNEVIPVIKLPKVYNECNASKR